MKIKNKIFAMSRDIPCMLEKPKAPEIRASTRNIIIVRNIATPLGLNILKKEHICKKLIIL